jgi:small subunit ribosomal protein S8
MAMLTDPIGDLLIRLKNASMRYHEKVEGIPHSKYKMNVLRVLKDEGFINDYEEYEVDGKKYIRVFMKYGPNKERLINDVKRVSKPGRRLYVDKDNIPKVMNGRGIAILTTSKGVLSDKEARELGVGGEIIAYVV